MLLTACSIFYQREIIRLTFGDKLAVTKHGTIGDKLAVTKHGSSLIPTWFPGLN